ncbi:diguanylate cyclase [Romboutsia sp.]|uniref:sensor domain-containing diguanylate cyclase n=1 Tax=Romboutsia sp. TaxID=1965302 RepID=UPI003F34EEB0
MDKYGVVEEYLEKFKQDKEHIDYFKKFYTYYNRSNPKYVNLVMEKVLEIAKECGYKNEYGWCLSSIGWYYSDCCEVDKAIEYHSKSNEIFIECNDMDGTSQMYNALLADYTKLGMFDMAIEYGLNGISIAEQSSREDLLPPLLINTANAYLQSGYYKEALELVKRLENLYCDIKDEHRAIMYNLLAEIHLKYEDNNAAYEYCYTAYKLVKKHNYSFLLSETLSILGEISHKIGKINESQEYFEESIKYANRYKIADIKIRTLIRWAKLNCYLNNLVEGEEKLKEAIEESKRINSNVLLKEIYEELSLIYIKCKDFEKAYYAKEELCKYEKEIFNQSSSVWFARLHSKTITQDAMAYKSLYNQIDIISKIGKKITSKLKKQSTFDTIYEEINMLLEADVFGIGLYNEEEKTINYEFLIEHGKRQENIPLKTDNEKSFAAYCVNNKRDIIINDLTVEYKDYKEAYEANKKKNEELPYSLIFCPLIKDGKVIGILNLQSYNKNAYTIKDLNTLKILKTYITIAIENSKLYDRANYLAKYDSLTGALNRREILKIGKKLFNIDVVKGQSFIILMLDVDHFKKINDTYSHNIGDYILKKMIGLIKLELGNNGIVGRYGGEEFLIVLPNTNLEEGYNLAEKIRKALEQYSYTISNDKSITVTVSIGVCALKESNTSFSNGIKLADEALYKAKNMGRNLVFIKNK